MNNFDRQQAAFASSLSAAAKLAGGSKRALAPPSPSPSVGSTTSAPAGGNGGTPRKDRDTPGASSSNLNSSGHPTVYSQPALTGTGESALAQMSYAVEWLRTKTEPRPYHEILGYLSIINRSEAEQEAFVDKMRAHHQIQWIPDPNLTEQTWRTGTYIHRPTIPNVRTKTQLLAYLQKKTDASGVSVKDLKDGWPDCEKAITELEQEHKVLVVRAKKDGVARMVWLDDPSVFHEVDPELKVMWSKVEVPSVENIVQRLIAAQQKPTSEDPRIKMMQAPKQEKKKKRAQRSTTKSTNSHMAHLLKDYSHMKR
ncbi:transcription initiation factor IIE subunit beta [Rhypophila sp. PSN 637]